MRFKLFFLPLLLLYCAGASALVYRDSLSYPFQFDDLANIVQNRSIRYVFHPRILTENAQSRPRPLTAFTYAADYAVAEGLSLSQFRLTNLLLHTLNGFLVALLFLQWFEGRPRRNLVLGALASAGLFLVLPLAVDSVAYLSARSSILSLFFVLLGLFFHGLPKQGFLSLFCFFGAALAGFLAKESAVALLPLLLLVHRVRQKVWRDLLPYAAPLVAGGLVLVSMKASYLASAWKGFFHIQGAVEINGFGEYLRISFSLWPKIFELFFRPSKMAVDHEIFLPPSWADPLVLGGIALWLAAFAVAFLWWRKPKSWQLPFLWIFASLVATNTIFPVLDPFSERHFYLATPAIGWALGMVFLWAQSAWITPLLFLVVGLASVGAQNRLKVWQSTSSLWQDCYRKYPTKFRVAFNAASFQIQDQADFSAALVTLKTYFAKILPGEIPHQQQEMATRMAGNILRYLGKDEAGIRKLHAATDGGFYADYILLKALNGMVSSAEWLALWQKTLMAHESSPISANAEEPQVVRHSMELLKAGFLAESGDRVGSRALYERVLFTFERSHMPYWVARESLGDIYRDLGMREAALEQYELCSFQHKVFKQFPQELHRKIYELRIAEKDFIRASDALGELVRVQSDNPQIRRLYAETLARAKNKNATRHEKEAAFYEQSYIPPQDEREIIRP